MQQFVNFAGRLLWRRQSPEKGRELYPPPPPSSYVVYRCKTLRCKGFSGTAFCRGCTGSRRSLAITGAVREKAFSLRRKGSRKPPHLATHPGPCKRTLDGNHSPAKEAISCDIWGALRWGSGALGPLVVDRGLKCGVWFVQRQWIGKPCRSPSLIEGSKYPGRWCVYFQRKLTKVLQMQPDRQGKGGIGGPSRSQSIPAADVGVRIFVFSRQVLLYHIGILNHHRIIG